MISVTQWGLSIYAIGAVLTLITLYLTRSRGGEDGHAIIELISGVLLWPCLLIFYTLDRFFPESDSEGEYW